MDEKDLFDFLKAGLTPFHVTSRISENLANLGYRAHTLEETWDGAPESFTVLHEDGALFAYERGDESLREGILILAAHTDSPAYRIKDRGVAWSKGFLVLPTETYGGPLAATWLDRELAVSGRVGTRSGETRLFTLPWRAIMANLAIHLNRKANEGIKYNAQDHLAAVADADPGHADEGAADEFAAMVADAAGVDSKELLEIDAFLSSPSKPFRVGPTGSLFSSPRLDNLLGCYASVDAFVNSKARRPRVLALYGHEEIGSQTGAGAASGLLLDLLKRIARSEGLSPEETDAMLARSRVVSNDAAHLIHPNYSDRYDPNYAPVPGGGPVLKMSGTYRYATTTRTAAEFVRSCEAVGVAVQRQTNRSDIKSGSTVGPITWARTGIPTVDVGVGILAMHSIVETADLRDVKAMIEVLGSYGGGDGP